MTSKASFELWLSINLNDWKKFDQLILQHAAIERLTLGAYDGSAECILLPPSATPSDCSSDWIIVLVPEYYYEYLELQLAYATFESEEMAQQRWLGLKAALATVESIADGMSFVISRHDLEVKRTNNIMDLDDFVQHQS